MRSTRGVLGVLVAVVILVCQALPASATTKTATDPNDVPGKLDLYRLHLAKKTSTAPLHITVKTYGPWAKRVLRDNVNKLIVYLDVDRNGSSDYHARIKKFGDKLLVFIAGSGSTFEPLPAHKPDRRTVTFAIPGNSPPNPNGTQLPQARAYSYFIESLPCDPGSGGSPCVDRAPNSGWL
jgi:hypothetical protein